MTVAVLLGCSGVSLCGQVSTHGGRTAEPPTNAEPPRQAELPRPAEPPRQSVLPPAAEPPAPIIPPTDANVSGAVAVKTASEQTWEQIHGYTFAQRDAFMTGLRRIEDQMAKSIDALKVRRSTYLGDPAAWDGEMKRLDDARTFLNSTSAELSKATAVNWDERRDRVEMAWERLQGAFARASALVVP